MLNTHVLLQTNLLPNEILLYYHLLLELLTMPGKVPERWEEYQPCGVQIKGTRFIAFKVPLEEVRPFYYASKYVQHRRQIGAVSHLFILTRTST